MFLKAPRDMQGILRPVQTDDGQIGPPFVRVQFQLAPDRQVRRLPQSFRPQFDAVQIDSRDAYRRQGRFRVGGTLFRLRKTVENGVDDAAML